MLLVFTSKDLQNVRVAIEVIGIFESRVGRRVANKF